MCNHSKPTSGFTLLELIVTISIAGILMAMAIPSFQDMIRNNRLTTYANELVTSLNIARSEAIKRGVTVSVAKIRKSDTTTTTYWSENGWNVFADIDGDGTLDANEEVIRTYAPLSTKFTLMANNFKNYITYKTDGTSNNNGSFAICDASDGNDTPEGYTSRLIIINKMGRIRIGKDSNNNGIPEKDDSPVTDITSCTSP